MKVRISGLPGLPVVDDVDYAALGPDAHKECIWRNSAHNYRRLEDWLCVGVGADDSELVFERKGVQGNLERKVLIDAHAGFGALGLGANPRKIKSVVAEFLKSDVPATVRLLDHSYYAPALHALLAVTGMRDGAGMLCFSGAYAVEAAYAIAQWYATEHKPGACKVVVAEKCLHGTTLLTRSLSSTPVLREGFGPLCDQHIIRVPFGNLDVLLQVMEKEGEAICAVLLEPMQCAAGCIEPPVGYLQAVQRMCKQHEAIFILDEVRTGFGHTGTDFMCEAEGVTPDLLIVGKSAGGSVFPVSAVVGRRDLVQSVPPGRLGVTMGALPVQCMVLLASIKELSDRRLADEAARKGAYLTDAVAALARRHPKAGIQIRGRGLARSVSTRYGGARVTRALFDAGVWTVATTWDETAFNLYPVLTIPDALLEEIVAALGRVLSDLAT